MKSISSLIYPLIVLVITACGGSESKEQIDAAHKTTLMQVAAMDSLYNLMIAQQVRTVTERDEIVKAVKNESDSAYLALRDRVKGNLLHQRALIDSMKIEVEKHQRFLKDIPVLEKGRRQIKADQALLSQTQEKLEKQYMDSQASMKSLRLYVDEGIK
ncbi:hypothetical protein [Solitalea lacus]|uniref:hypothetical protein n=1 Tax=Solitalea lacus TaxID=2911172 RepID=UPI001EDC1BB9|nr:hypothetical protein [Solitalea lacus]UKJ06642.1 hypothetical protein L2B55_14025 [Solitalea lacus]